MLDEVVIQPCALPQELLSKSCTKCGVEVFGRTMHKQYCDVCRAERRLETYRAAAHVQRRKQGIPLSIGAEATCQMCSAVFIADGSRPKYCKDCRPIAASNLARRNAYMRGADAGRKRVGRVEQCAHCDAAFVVTNRGRADYCAPCAKLSKAGRLPHRREALRAYSAVRRKIPMHAINDLMRGGILRSISDKGGRSWQGLVGYTAEQLKAHLERQFQPGMTWGNRGVNGWHIDHRLPLSSFNFSSADDPEFKAAWSITNLQPMWGDENIRKKDQILYLL